MSQRRRVPHRFARDIRRRCVVVRTSSAPSAREIVATGILRACTGSTTVYDSIRASVAEMVDDDEDQEELTTPIGLPGRRVAGRRGEEIPSLHVVKTFSEAFYIG